MNLLAKHNAFFNTFNIIINHKKRLKTLETGLENKMPHRYLSVILSLCLIQITSLDNQSSCHISAFMSPDWLNKC